MIWRHAIEKTTGSEPSPAVMVSLVQVFSFWSKAFCSWNYFEVPYFASTRIPDPKSSSLHLKGQLGIKLLEFQGVPKVVGHPACWLRIGEPDPVGPSESQKCEVVWSQAG